MLENVLTILELNWNQRLGHKKTKLQNRLFHVLERTRTSVQNVKKWKLHVQSVQKTVKFIVKYANLWGFSRRRRRGCLGSQMYLSRPGRG
mgnify:CR=1 FL=1